MIVAENLTKRYGSTTAVDDVSFAVQPGQVTGFLGPNGAGKSTTMRMIVGLDAPSSGRVTVGGHLYTHSRSPLTEVGVLLDAKAVHTGRSARGHLRAMAATHGIPTSRVDEVIALTGLEAVANKRAGKFSLGMGQRLGIAGDRQPLQPRDLLAHRGKLFGGDAVGVAAWLVGMAAQLDERTDVVDTETKVAGMAHEGQPLQLLPAVTALVAVRPFGCRNQTHLLVVADGGHLHPGATRKIANGKHDFFLLKL